MNVAVERLGVHIPSDKGTLKVSFGGVRLHGGRRHKFCDGHLRLGTGESRAYFAILREAGERLTEPERFFLQ